MKSVMYRPSTTVASDKPGCNVDTRCRHTRIFNDFARSDLWLSRGSERRSCPAKATRVGADFRIGDPSSSRRFRDVRKKHT